MTFVAEGLGVSLAREHIKKLPHPGVAFRPLTPPVKSDYCIAWNRDNDSRALQEYIRDRQKPRIIAAGASTRFLESSCSSGIRPAIASK